MKAQDTLEVIVYSRSCPKCSKEIIHNNKHICEYRKKINSICKDCAYDKRRKYQVPSKGEIFGDWTVIDDNLQHTDSAKSRGVMVQCICGTRKVLTPTALNRKQSQSCANCLGRRLAVTNYLGYESLSMAYFKQVKTNASQRGITFDITIEKMYNLYVKQNGCCALSRVPIELTRSYANNIRKGNYEAASLDRIDSSKGYIEGNVQWVHKTVNRIKTNLHQEEFIKWCKLIAENN